MSTTRHGAISDFQGYNWCGVDFLKKHGGVARSLRDSVMML